MTDTIVKGTGNSRFLRSSIPENITFPEFVSLLRAGTFPIDLAGINDEGIEVKGTALSKGTLLSDATETAIWGDAADRTVDEALSYSFSALMGYAGEKATVVAGTYTGDGNVSQTIPLGFTPKAVIVSAQSSGNWIVGYSSGFSYQNYIAMAINGYRFSGPIGTLLEIVDGGFDVYYKHGSPATVYANVSSRVYSYIAIT